GRERRGLPLAADQRDERNRERGNESRDRDPEREREPDGLGPEPPRGVVLAGASRPRDLGGRPVLKEVEDREERAEDRRRDPERGELGAAEMPDDGRVDEQVERFSGEGAERGEREPDDLAVVRRSEPHADAAIVASYAAT